MINALALQMFMVLTHTWLDDFCGGILISSQRLGVLWEILMLCYRWMTTKGVASNQVSCWINTNDLSCIPFTESCYTWCNGRRGLHIIHRSLDRALCNGVFLDE